MHPGSRPSLCTAPIAYAAATCEGVDYSTGPWFYGTLVFKMPLAALCGPPPGAAFALPHPDKPCSYQDGQGRGILRGVPVLN
jgi:hypothetical protein